jgi:hypothetical protein
MLTGLNTDREERRHCFDEEPCHSSCPDVQAGSDRAKYAADKVGGMVVK